MTATTPDLTIIRCSNISVVIFLFGRSQEFLESVLQISADFRCADIRDFANTDEMSRFAADVLKDCHLAILCLDPEVSECDARAQMILSHVKSPGAYASLVLASGDGPSPLSCTKADTVVRLSFADALQLVTDIASSLANQGYIGIDAFDIGCVLKHPGTATLLVAHGTGVHRTQLALTELSDRWSQDLTSGIQAAAALVLITGGIRLSEVKQIINGARQLGLQNIHYACSVTDDNSLGDTLRVSLLLKL